jgi:glyoxylase-like metal-dependent hydrolase (beta-lactamase superfamily II)
VKQLHRSDLFNWSEFNEERNIDFNGTLWLSPAGNVLIDPVTFTEHDINHLESLGGAAHVIITNSDHVRDAAKILLITGAKCWGPAAEKEDFPISCDGWLSEEEQPIKGIEVFCLNGSKTPGELALLIDNKTLVTGDLIRSHEGGHLRMLPEAKLQNRELALKSIKRMASITNIQAVIPGDGWPVFNYGHEALLTLSQEI